MSQSSLWSVDCNVIINDKVYTQLTYNAPVTLPQSLIYAYAQTTTPQTLSKHQQYGSLVLSQTSAVYQLTMPTDLKWLHGYGMAFIMLVTIPISFYFARYKPVDAWFAVHVTLNVLGLVIAAVSPLLLALFNYTRPSRPHGILGLTLIVLLAGQFVTGWLKIRLQRSLDHATAFKIVKLIHSTSGGVFWIGGIVQVGIGLNTMIPFANRSFLNQWAAYFALVTLWILLLSIKEYAHQKRVKTSDMEESTITRKPTILDNVHYSYQRC
jgi:Eukaryotic cytochrome b561